MTGDPEAAFRRASIAPIAAQADLHLRERLMMPEKLKTGVWFLRRPDHWAHAAALIVRKVRPNRDSPDLRRQAREWAAQRAVSVRDALLATGLLSSTSMVPEFPAELLEEAQRLSERSAVEMGGAGDLNLIHAAARLSGARHAIETGVAYGWSSLAILAALAGRPTARLTSVDMPYPKRNNEAFVGIVVPDPFRENWDLIREPDRRGLSKALSRHPRGIDLAHYDSDKSWWGRRYAYPMLWSALRPGGVFISDDIQDNMAFAEFVEDVGAPFAVTEYQSKFVGIVRKLGVATENETQPPSPIS
jgi:predicted O-methyltransferase YrrM